MANHSLANSNYQTTPENRPATPFAKLIALFRQGLDRSARLEGYFPALAVLAFGVVLHAASLYFLGHPFRAFFVIYLLVLLIGSWCGYGPGVLVILLTACGVPYLFRPGFDITQVNVGGVAMVLVVSLIISRTAATRRRTESFLIDSNTELDRRVRQKTAELEQRVAELEALYSKLPVGLCYLDRQLRFLRISEELAAISGVSVEQHSGRRLGEVLPNSLTDKIEPLLQRVLETGEPLLRFDFQGPLPMNEADERDWLLDCAPVLTEDGGLLGLQVILQDVTETKRAERALEKANAELRRVNDELGQFAYIAAHDLQEPLRTVVTFSQLVQRRYKGKLEAKADDYLNHIVAAGRRMSQLIADVLDYSRASEPGEGNSDQVDLNRVLVAVLDRLKSRISETGALITCDTLPVVPGNSAQLAQVFQNLLSNSIKYAKQGVSPEIYIKAACQNGYWLMSVSDNGIGFHPRYADRIFGIFKRLHGSDLPGSGIGLAICKKVLDRHGGQIWAQSQENAGATFYFTLPAAKAKSAKTAG